MVVVYHATMVHRCLEPADLPSGAGPAALRHAVDWTRWLNAGVPIFFVISGYCITAAVERSRQLGQSAVTYFWRRLRRIYPPLWIVIACSLAFFLVLEPPGKPEGVLVQQPWSQIRPWWHSAWSWLGNLTLTETWRHHLVGSPGNHHFPGQAWTLCYEEQFYAVMGLLLLLATRRLFPAAAAVTAAVALVALGSRAAGVPVEGFFFDGNWFMFAAGVAVYFALHRAAAPGRWLVGLSLAAALAYSATRLPLEPAVSYASAFGFALVILAAHRWDGWLAAAPLLRPLMFCGTICYSMYLVHQLPVKALTQYLCLRGFTSDSDALLMAVPASVAVSVLLGWLFHITVERRFLPPPAEAGRAKREKAAAPELAAAGA
jgi:peptidoglycan/LPS O-acetylase OafA/YrhL